MKLLRHSPRIVLWLAVSALLAAIILTGALPFSPQITFEPIPTASYNDREIIEHYDMRITNEGSVPIWIAASSPTTPVYVHASGYTELNSTLSASGLTETMVAIGRKPFWIRLDPKKTMTISLNAALKRPHLLGLLSSDWRGHEAESWSQSYVPPGL
jgi:hypothetical protein